MINDIALKLYAVENVTPRSDLNKLSVPLESFQVLTR
jgi:hypothetical protein